MCVVEAHAHVCVCVCARACKEKQSPLMINAAAECKTNKELSGVIPLNPVTNSDFIGN